MSVSLVMIARNEERCIARALQSVKSFVDEMIVVDTGSTDNTAAIATLLGARVYHFQWRDDFSAARNHALSLSSYDWRLVMDADEYLTSGSDEVIRHTQTPALQPCGKMVTIENVREKTTSTAFLPRLLSRDVRYTGIVHEQPNLAMSDCVMTAIVLSHDGYLQQHRQKKENRNIELLKKALKTSNNAYYHFQLGTEYLLNAEWMLCKQHLEAALPDILNCTPAIRNDFARKYLHCLTLTHDFHCAMQFINSHKAQFQHDPGFLYAIGVLLVAQTQYEPEKLEALIPQIEKQWIITMKRCVEVMQAGILMPGMSAQDCFRLSAQHLMLQYEMLGETEKATGCANMLA